MTFVVSEKAVIEFLYIDERSTTLIRLGSG